MEHGPIITNSLLSTPCNMLAMVDLDLWMKFRLLPLGLYLFLNSCGFIRAEDEFFDFSLSGSIA